MSTHATRTGGTKDVLSVEEGSWGQGGQFEIPMSLHTPEVVVMVPKVGAGSRNNSKQCFPKIKGSTSSPLWVLYHAQFLGEDNTSD